MSALLPAGYLAFREAAAFVQRALFAGQPDRPELLKLRKDQEMYIGDEKERQKAITELWSAIDGGKVRLMAVGGHPRKLIRINAELSKEIPFLRHPKVCSFHYLRSSHHLHSTFVSWFGSNLAAVSLAVREIEVQKLARQILRTRRRKTKGASRRGRPSSKSSVLAAIEEIIEAEHWRATQSIKALTRLVNKRLKGRNVSADTVARSLDQLYQDTSDRRYLRIKRTREPPRRRLAQGNR